MTATSRASPSGPSCSEGLPQIRNFRSAPDEAELSVCQLFSSFLFSSFLTYSYYILFYLSPSLYPLLVWGTGLGSFLFKQLPLYPCTIFSFFQLFFFSSDSHVPFLFLA